MALSSDALQDFKPETVRGAPGFFRVGQSRDGVWSLIDPNDRPFFARAVNDVTGIVHSPHDPVARLRSWGFNTLGPGSMPELHDDGLAWIATVDFCSAAPAIRTGGARLPDVFDPAWPATAAWWAAERCAPMSERRDVLGWLADDDLGWARPEGGRPSLLQICLSLEPGFAAYHAAWEFVLAPHAGRLAALAKAWSHPMANKEVLRELTRADRGVATRGYLRDDARWLREFAGRYFATTSAAIRAHAPLHLVLGARGRCAMRGKTDEGVTAACAPPTVDVAWVHWTDLGAVSPGPVLAGDFSWASEDFFGLPPGGRTPGLTSVERMLRRGRAALRRLIMDPSVVGYAWRQWRDAAGEQPPFAGGLVHGNDAEAREHTELVADMNAKVPILRPSFFPLSSR